MNDFEKVTTHEEAEKDAMKMLQGDFGFDDFLRQMQMIQKMGSLRSLKSEKIQIFWTPLASQESQKDAAALSKILKNSMIVSYKQEP